MSFNELSRNLNITITAIEENGEKWGQKNERLVFGMVIKRKLFTETMTRWDVKFFLFSYLL